MLDKKFYINGADINIHEDDRVNITLKEYEDLKKQLNNLTEERNHLKETVDKIIKPFIVAKIPEEVVQGMFDNKFDATVEVFPGFDDPLIQKIALIVKVRKDN